MNIEENDEKIIGKFLDNNLKIYKNEEDNDYSVSFIGNQKNIIKNWMPMFDVFSKGPLPLKTNIKCWHCRNNFNTLPIGCPIKYNRASEDLKNFLENGNFVYNSSYYYETEGIFCSFSCVKSYIQEQNFKFPTRYIDSNAYLLDIYQILQPEEFKKDPNIKFAKSWKELKDYGGYKSIEDLRNDSTCAFETINVKRPFMFSNCVLFEEKRNRKIK